MQGSGGGDRSIRLVTSRRPVTSMRDAVGPGTLSVSYPGILLVGYAGSTPVCRRWVPFGEEPTEDEDEGLIDALREAMLWQQHLPCSSPDA